MLLDFPEGEISPTNKNATIYSDVFEIGDLLVSSVNFNH